MSDIHAIISELDEYCSATGLSPATICGRALNNARLYGRLKAKSEKLDEDIAVLRTFMQQNPPAKRGVSK